MKAYDFGYKTLEQIVERINYGAVQGFEDHTSEFFAASYSLNGLQNSVDNGGNAEDGIRYDLEYLQLNGAEFDLEKALHIGLELFAQQS